LIEGRRGDSYHTVSVGAHKEQFTSSGAYSSPWPDHLWLASGCIECLDFKCFGKAKLKPAGKVILIMASGYEKSPDYGGPQPDPLAITAGVLLLVVTVAVVGRLWGVW
jgi:hypothetical protein